MNQYARSFLEEIGTVFSGWKTKGNIQTVMSKKRKIQKPGLFSAPGKGHLHFCDGSSNDFRAAQAAFEMKSFPGMEWKKWEWELERTSTKECAESCDNDDPCSLEHLMRCFQEQFVKIS